MYNVHVCSTSKSMIFAYIHDIYVHVRRKKVPIYTHKYECAAKYKHVLLLAHITTETRQKVAICPDREEHFLHIFESLSPEIYAVDCELQITCTCVLYSVLSLRAISHRIAGVQLRGG